MRKLYARLAMAVLPALALVAFSLRAADQTHLHIHVVNDAGKPVGNAEVIIKFLEARSVLKPIKRKESWELRTTQEGMASPPGIPLGKILIQINAKNYQTFGQVYDIADAEKTVEIQLNPPQAQYSADPAPAAGKK